jgi:DNA-binding transcriptional MerR regulator
MDEILTIGKVAQRTGLPAKTIRFYEEEGLLPEPRRSDTGYRLYSHNDVARLQLVRRIRLLGVDLATIKTLADKVLSESCGDFADDLTEVLGRQLSEIDTRISELTELRGEIVQLTEHVIHCCEGCDPDQMASECSYCFLLIDDERR